MSKKLHNNPNGSLNAVGFNVTIPQYNAGILKLPAISLPNATLHNPNLTNAASPPLEPPGVLLIS